MGERPKFCFEDLELYKIARTFRIRMYRLASALPADEKYNLIPQIRRASLSLTNNIAEGHGRFHYLDNIRFLRQSRGSLQELIDDLNIILDEQYDETGSVEELKDEAYILLKRINGYISYLKQRNQNKGGDRPSRGLSPD